MIFMMHVSPKEGSDPKATRLCFAKMKLCMFCKKKKEFIYVLHVYDVYVLYDGPKVSSKPQR